MNATLSHSKKNENGAQALRDVSCVGASVGTPVFDRLSVWLRNLRNLHVRVAIAIFIRAMRKDRSLAHAWHCNIAMPIYDATRPRCHCDPMLGHYHSCYINSNSAEFHCREMPIEQANHIAEKLMAHLFGVENSSQHK